MTSRVADTMERAEKPRSPSTRHMGFLDGLRGLAALYVVLFHVYELFLARHRDALSRPLRLALGWMGYGHYAVDLFIVLSGFCLMLPVVAPSNTGHMLRGGATGYLVRRARRILPPYYAALAISMALNFGWQGTVQIIQGRANFAVGDILSHLGLFHNLHRDWNMGINGALWSVATEWQIYFFMPLLLLPVWRHLGIFATVLVAFVVGLLPHFLLPASWNYDWACPWYLGLFAQGMLGATIASASSGRLYALYSRASWPWLTLASAAISLFMMLSHHLGTTGTDTNAISQKWVLDSWIGCTALCLILACTIKKQQHSIQESVQHSIQESVQESIQESVQESVQTVVRFLPLKFLESRAAIFAGSFSYSIYLIHQPLLERTMDYTNRLPINANLLCILIFVVLVPVTLVICYLFFLVFERPGLVKQRSLKS